MIYLLNNKYLKIVLLLGTVFVISDFSIKNVFLENSPRLNPFIAQNMMEKINEFGSKTTSLIASKGNIFNFLGATKSSFGLIKDLPQKTLAVMNTPLKQVRQGVYAGEMDNIQVYKIRSNEIDYLFYTFTINGKEVKIKVPKGVEPPSQEVVEALYK